MPKPLCPGAQLLLSYCSLPCNASRPEKPKDLH